MKPTATALALCLALGCSREPMPVGPPLGTIDGSANAGHPPVGRLPTEPAPTRPPTPVAEPAPAPVAEPAPAPVAEPAPAPTPVAVATPTPAAPVAAPTPAAPTTAAPTPPLGALSPSQAPGPLPGQGGILPGQGGVLPHEGGSLFGQSPMESTTISKNAAILNALAQTIIILGAIVLSVIAPLRRRRRPG